ncbi:MAG: hypothetical protein MUO54_08240 [Anaerolineales bacterium]|nr:hypothetical protein [Anaerolineales bacterium]
MFTSRYKIILVCSILLSLSLACSLTGSSAEPAPAMEDTIATSVAATVAAGEINTPATIAVDPAVPESPPEPDVLFQGASFSFDDSLADTVSFGTWPGEGDLNSAVWSTPDHSLFSFNGWVLTDAFHAAAIRIYPVAEFRAINPNVSDRLDELMTVIDTQPADDESIAVADLFNAAQFVRSQVEYLQFQNGQGVRFLSQYGQAAAPVGWPNLFYAFQGFTNDGAYFISAILPVNHPSLPHPDNVILDNAFYDNFMNYAAEMSVQLNGEDPGTFIPSLFLLDEMIESLLVEGE